MSAGESDEAHARAKSPPTQRRPVLCGKKKIEYRSRPTSKRERVYIYAANTPADQEAWDEIGLEPGDLPTGVLVGTVEIVGCRKTKIEYEWDLARSVRLKRHLNRRIILSPRSSIRSEKK